MFDHVRGEVRELEKVKRSLSTAASTLQSEVQGLQNIGCSNKTDEERLPKLFVHLFIFSVQAVEDAFAELLGKLVASLVKPELARAEETLVACKFQELRGSLSNPDAIVELEKLKTFRRLPQCSQLYLIWKSLNEVSLGVDKFSNIFGSGVAQMKPKAFKQLVGTASHLVFEDLSVMVAVNSMGQALTKKSKRKQGAARSEFWFCCAATVACLQVMTRQPRSKGRLGQACASLTRIGTR